jgi:hypothetical protein
MTIKEVKRLVTEWHEIARSAEVMPARELREVLEFIDELGEKSAAFDLPYVKAPSKIND